MDIENVVERYNNGVGLLDLAKEFEVSRSTMQRRITGAGYIYNAKLKKYEMASSDLHEIVNNDSIGILSNVSRETIRSEKMVNGSYTIPASLAKALKFKAVAEGKNAVDIIRELLESNVEEKYFRY